MKTYLLVFWIFVSYQVVAQQFLDSLIRESDSTRVFTIDDLFAVILANHPVVRQADILTENAKQEIRLARGSFDPKLSVNWVKKENNGVNYYDKLNSELKFPLRLPIEPKIGIDRNDGEYLNPESYVADQYHYRQVYAGISLPLGRGLITDERRTTLRQAALFPRLAEAEKVKAVNKILFDAAKDYWSWFDAYYNYVLFLRAVDVSRDVFQRSRLNFELGELAAIDTVQAKIIVQQREVALKEAELEYRNASVNVSFYLWDTSGNPIELNSQSIPSPDALTNRLDFNSVAALKSEALENHPDLLKIRLKMQQLELERRLAIENLKPQLDLNYNLLNEPLTPSGDMSFAGRDYKIGLEVSFPLFLRKERSKVALTRLKMSETSFEEKAMTQRVMNEIEVSYNRLSTLNEILDQQVAMVVSYDRLFEAEILNVTNGESDLFKLNFQQEKLLEAQSKAIKVVSDIQKEQSALFWAAGVLRLGMPER